MRSLVGRARRSPAAALLALAALLFFTPVVAAQDASGTVAGRVTDDRGAAVGHVEVIALVDGRRVARALTDASGLYRMEVPAGSVRLSIPAGFNIRATRSEPVSIAPGGTATVDLTVEWAVIDLEQMVVTGSSDVQGRSLRSVGGWVGSVDEAEIRRDVSINPTDIVGKEAGAHLVDTGLGSRVISFRGFGNIFSGAVRYLVDYRKASLPSLRANFMHFVPTTGPDTERMELVLGPSSVIYGPNSANGVLNVLTRSPLDLPESSISISGGTQSVLQTEVRSAQRLGEHVGIKISGRWFSGEEFAYADPVELAILEEVLGDPDGFRDGLLDIGVPASQIGQRMSRVGIRDRDIRRWSADARMDWSPSEGDTLFLQAGHTNTTGIEVTPLGAAQARDWVYEYAQARVRSGSFFAQAYVNGSDAGSSYLLRDGAPLVDGSRLVGLQVRHGFSVAGGREEVTYGGDWARTTPRTGGTIHGQFEDDDEITEYGGYLQSRTQITDPLSLIATLRVDESNVIEDPVVSPRLGVVVEAGEGHTFSASWSRGFATPTPTNYFLDISGGAAPDALGPLGYRVRARGTGRDGIRFTDGAGGYQGMRSPCTPQAAGGPSALVPVSANGLLQCVAGVMEAAGGIDAATAALLRALDLGDAVGIDALDPVTGAKTPLVPGAVTDVTPLRENTATTLEIGYRGLVRDGIYVQAAAWRTTRENFASPLLLRTPLLTLDEAGLAAFLEAGGLPAQQAAALAAGASAIPGAVLSSSDIRGQGAELVATYENFGEITYWGIDLGVQAELSRTLTLSATGSSISDDHFRVGGRVIPLNAPEVKGSLALTAANLPVPVSGSLGLRYHSGFPVSSGDYVGTACLGVSGPLVEECVSSATLLDASFAYEGLLTPDLSLRVAVKNVLDSEYRPFVGVPTSGRQILTKLEYRLR